MTPQSRTYAIILAGGKGQRMGGILKQFLLINKKNILLYSLDVFTRLPFLEGIIIVVPESKISETKKLVSSYSYKKFSVIAGGDSRRGSSYNALTFIQSKKGGCDYVIFHDGVRPLVTEKMVTTVLAMAKKYKGAVLGSKALNVIVSLTKKQTISKALNAETVYNTQTPHCYQFSLIKNAHENPRAQGKKYQSLENIELFTLLGEPVFVVTSFYRNMKLTFPQDLIPLSALIKKNNDEKFFSS